MPNPNIEKIAFNDEAARMFLDEHRWGNEMLANMGGSTASVRGSDLLHNVQEAIFGFVPMPDDEIAIIQGQIDQSQPNTAQQIGIGDYVPSLPSSSDFFKSWIGADFGTVMRTIAIVCLAILLIGLGIAGLLFGTETGREIVKKGGEAALA